MDDPIQTNDFISKIIEARKDDIVGVAISKGDRLTIRKDRSKFEYIFSLLIIMGFYHFFKNYLITVIHKIRKKLHSIFPGLIKDPSVLALAEKYNIKNWKINNPNDEKFLEEIKNLEIDVIINQSQNILKKNLLKIPKIGVINRHNALLPKNRGRLTPFWVLYKGEEETGVSIHFVTEELDAGDIIVQKRFLVSKKDNFNTLVKKNYKIAFTAMLEALDKMEKGDKNYINNEKNKASYNSIPTLKEAWGYRKKRILNFLGMK